MARGRKPDPAELQAAKGNPGRRKPKTVAARSRIEPVQIGQVKPPRWLRRSKKATEVWNDLAPRLADLNLVSHLDAVPLGRYCRYVVEWIAADISVQKEGTWYNATGTNGEQLKKRHPAWQACQDLEKMLREIEGAFGMRPDTRFKIMRDQAAAHGLLPLFGDREGDRQVQPESPSTDAAKTSSTELDALGLLGSFNSTPPTRPN